MSCLKGLRQRIAALCGACVALCVILLFHQQASAFSLTMNAVLNTSKGFVSPAGVTADANNVYVADYGANGIIMVNTGKTATAKIVTVSRPISVAYYNNKLYVVTESNFGLIYNLTVTSTILPSATVTAGGTFGTGDLVNPSDVHADATGVYVTDMGPANAHQTGNTYVRMYPLAGAATGTNIGAGAFPVEAGSGANGNGMMYIPSSVWGDGTKVFVADYGNVTPAYLSTSTTNRYGKMVTATSYVGNPRGMVQTFTTSGTLEREYLLHGGNTGAGELLNISGIWGDASYIYVVDSQAQHIAVFSNVYAAPGGGTNVPYALPSTLANLNPPSGFAKVFGIADLGTGPDAVNYTNMVAMLKDITRVGAGDLVVTDTTGRVFYFTVVVP